MGFKQSIVVFGRFNDEFSFVVFNIKSIKFHVNKFYYKTKKVSKIFRFALASVAQKFGTLKFAMCNR